MRKGYYFTRYPRQQLDGSLKMEDFWAKCKGYTQVWMDWELGKPKPIGFMPLFGKKMWVDLGMYEESKETKEYVTRVLTALKPKWKKVIALELGDELKWPAEKINARVAMVNKVMLELGLSDRPIGITFHHDQIFENDNWKANLDYIGLEAYLDYQPGETPGQAARRQENNIKSLLDRIGPSKKVILVAQAYNRNGTWKNVDSLVAIQEPVFRAAKMLGDRLIMLSMFAYARAKMPNSINYPVSTIDIPRLEIEIKRLCRLYG